MQNLKIYFPLAFLSCPSAPGFVGNLCGGLALPNSSYIRSQGNAVSCTKPLGAEHTTNETLAAPSRFAGPVKYHRGNEDRDDVVSGVITCVCAVREGRGPPVRQRRVKVPRGQVPARIPPPPPICASHRSTPPLPRSTRVLFFVCGRKPGPTQRL